MTDMPHPSASITRIALLPSAASAPEASSGAKIRRYRLARVRQTAAQPAAGSAATAQLSRG